jgi:flavin reductase (DIM6/NTAB) family NADH-FMN oxidoreductase RutF
VAKKRFFSRAEIDALQRSEGVMDPVAHSLRAPMAQFLLVTRDVSPAGAVCVRATQLTPLSWRPYTQAVNIPLDDERAVRNLSRPEAQCVLALPTRHQLREVMICSQRAPEGVCEADLARLALCRSLYVDVPTIESCPVNLECVVDRVELFHTHLIAFTRVVGASIDASVMFKEREEIVALYPTNLVDDVVDEKGHVRRRVSVLGEVQPCPTFPYAEKAGWCFGFGNWVRDLRDERYLSEAEHDQLIAWEKRWDALFPDLDSPERAVLKERLAQVCRLLVQGRWAAVHEYLAGCR